MDQSSELSPEDVPDDAVEAEAKEDKDDGMVSNSDVCLHCVDNMWLWPHVHWTLTLLSVQEDDDKWTWCSGANQKLHTQHL